MAWEVIGISGDVTTIVLSDGCDVPVKVPSVYIALCPWISPAVSCHQAEGLAPLLAGRSFCPNLDINFLLFLLLLLFFEIIMF